MDLTSLALKIHWDTRFFRENDDPLEKWSCNGGNISYGPINGPGIIYGPLWPYECGKRRKHDDNPLGLGARYFQAMIGTWILMADF